MPIHSSKYDVPHVSLTLYVPMGYTQLLQVDNVGTGMKNSGLALPSRNIVHNSRTIIGLAPAMHPPIDTACVLLNEHQNRHNNLPAVAVLWTKNSISASIECFPSICFSLEQPLQSAVVKTYSIASITILLSSS